MNSTPFVRQCDILSNRWGDFNAKRSTEQTIHTGIQETGGRNDARGTAIAVSQRKPNLKWVTDVTELSLFGEKRYLSPILDLHSSDLVSYTISDRPVLSMVTTMLDKAFAKIPDNTNLILHSDQGWQYQHKQYQWILREKGIRPSMSRKGNCLDNAVIENFFGLLKSELLYLQKIQSMEHFKQELIDYPDYYYNRRIKAKLKGLSPTVHSQQALSAS